MVITNETYVFTWLLGLTYAQVTTSYQERSQQGHSYTMGQEERKYPLVLSGQH